MAEQGRDGLVALIREISLSPAPLSFDSIFELVGPGSVFNGRALETTALETVLSSGHVDIVADSTLHQSLVRFRGLDVLRAGVAFT